MAVPVTPTLLRLLVFIIRISFHAQYKYTLMLHLRHFAILAIFAIAASISAAAKDLAVVVNKANETKVLSSADLTKILKNTTRRWSNGQEVIVVVRDPNSPAMRVLLQKVFAMSPEQFRAFANAANQGRTSPAFVIADSDDVVLKMVASSAGAVGITDVYAINSSVNVVKVEGKMPLEPGYLLHGIW
jgi:ABC-type phosphate transport system substrate-binding protein